MSTRYLLLFGAIVLVVLGALHLPGAPPPQTGPATEKRFPPLKLPPGFKATLFACDPLIEYPSVISIGPKPGAIFVAIDYMTGLGTDGKVKSEIRLVEDTDGDGYADKATVVAKGFNSIQGLAYHDDTLFVMHAPFLTSLRYNKKTGVADERKDLLSGLGLKPEDNSSRLHCANGVVVGHDGWLYLAQGDNGVNVLRPEGDRLIFNGGGILRCRPDGRDLHVFSTGLRNIYDIALDAELNVFTRDNENDGGTYMIRVCHSFFGADHGYPYDYEERPDHAMKPIGDFGLGSSAGGVCYLETQFPPEYRGNLFFCEWGKSVVRYPLTPSLSSFAPVKELEFATGDPKDVYPFKPTDIVVQRDGSLMVSDYADGQRPKRGRGRIYHISHTGKAMPSKTNGLDSESSYERCEAQAALERTGKKPTLQSLGRNGRLHAIWTLAHVDGPKAIDALLAIGRLDPDPDVRGQAIRAIADLADPVLLQHKLDAEPGDPDLARRIADLGKNQNTRIKLEVVVALGRLRWKGTPDWLNEQFAGAGSAFDHAAMQALRRADNWPAVLKLLDKAPGFAIRPVALRALADRYDPKLVDDIIERLHSSNDQVRRREYAELLTRVYKKPGPWKYWGYRPGPRPVNIEAWERTDAIEKALDGYLANSNHAERPAILKKMQRERVPVRLATLHKFLKNEYDSDAVTTILTALRDYPPAEVHAVLDGLVRDPNRSQPNRLQAIDMLIKEKNADVPRLLIDLAKTLEDGLLLVDVLARLGAYPKHEAAVSAVAPKLKSSDPRVRAAAITSLGELRAAAGRDAVLTFLQDKDARVRRAAAGAAGKLDVKSAADSLLKLLAETDSEMKLACLDSLTRLRETRVVPIAVKALNDHALGPKALECIAELGGPAEARAVVDFVKRSPSADNLAVAVRGLSKWNEKAKRKELDLAIAELHGAGGVLLRWEAGGPFALKDRDRTVEIAKSVGASPRDWRTLFAEGPEGRLGLGSKADPVNPLWFAFADVEVPTPTPIEFLASSRGAFEVWLNGKSIHRRAKDGKYQVDSDRFAGSFEKGLNRVLVQTGGDSPIEFHLRFRRKSPKIAHEKLTQAALNRAGNAERGRKVFFDKDKSQCIKCHQLGNQGERIGPELTGVGGRFSRIYLVESILEPSRTIAPSFGTLVVTLKNGKQWNGVRMAENETTLTLADNQGQQHVVKKGDIDELNVSTVSTMPEGLELRLTEDEFVDLIAFLASQQESPGAKERRGP